jgi:hypothetical protein
MSCKPRLDQRGQAKMEVVYTIKKIALAAIYDDCMVLWSGFGNVCVEFCNMETNQTHMRAKEAHNYFILF